jgi:hypothetical protein
MESIMPSAQVKIEPSALYSIEELRLLRADIVQYARMFPPGAKRNEHRQIALSLRRLFKNQAWLDGHTDAKVRPPTEATLCVDLSKIDRVDYETASYLDEGRRT